MRNLAIVSNNDKLTSLIGIVQDAAPFVLKRFYAVVQQSHQEQWLEHCYNKTEDSACHMYHAMLHMLESDLPAYAANEIADRFNKSVAYQETAIYNQLDSEEQEAQDAFWSKSDEQADFDDKVNMYYNEI